MLVLDSLAIGCYNPSVSGSATVRRAAPPVFRPIGGACPELIETVFLRHGVNDPWLAS